MLPVSFDTHLCNQLFFYFAVLYYCARSLVAIYFARLALFELRTGNRLSSLTIAVELVWVICTPKLMAPVNFLFALLFARANRLTLGADLFMSLRHECFCKNYPIRFARASSVASLAILFLPRALSVLHLFLFTMRISCAHTWKCIISSLSFQTVLHSAIGLVYVLKFVEYCSCIIAPSFSLTLISRSMYPLSINWLRTWASIQAVALLVGLTVNSYYQTSCRCPLKAALYHFHCVVQIFLE